MTKNKLTFKALLRFFALAVLIALFVFLAYEFGIIELFLNEEKLKNFIQSLGPFGVVGFVLLQAFQVVAAPIPGEITGLLGGYLYGTFWGIVLSTVGLTLGSVIAFILGRIFGKPFVERVVDPMVLNKFDYLLHHKGAFLVFFLFLIPGFPKDYLSYFLGLSRLSLLEFTVIAGIGRLLGTVLLSFGGDYLRHHEYGKFLGLAGIAVVVMVIVWLFKDKIERLLRIWHISKYRKNKQKK
ncbi:TVP38/TMEM64 family protein [Thermodesulfovibrio yellowstonii]|uniref:TVP38/TMEM64 family protein n=1 Tax=Thermodesulfovibrio yellowstonii TaxID=28262 RepID=UPI0024B3A049|nr:TVP38/TMEM64 family protein [Thermodesulfovibrio yellowstonii]MDI6865209.1 TVP38/TMEM64 family protein [Thermodesulfovibrio yellowstonii]